MTGHDTPEDHRRVRPGPAAITGMENAMAETCNRGVCWMGTARMCTAVGCSIRNHLAVYDPQSDQNADIGVTDIAAP